MVYYSYCLMMSGSSIKIGSTFFHSAAPAFFQTFSLSTQYSKTSPTREGVHTRSPVSPSVSAVNHRGLWGGIRPSSLAFLMDRCFSSCAFFKSFASSYLPSSNARWSGRNLQSVGQIKGFNVSFGQSFSVIAKGVKLNGEPAGFSEFFQRRKCC